MKNDIPDDLIQRVRRRSRSRCEYCQLWEAGQGVSFHADHVQPVSSGGQTVADNVALVCPSCSLLRGSRQAAIDPATGDSTLVFNPRIDVWREHFRWDGVRLVGVSPAGRATVELLDMNRPVILAIREEEVYWGRLD